MTVSRALADRLAAPLSAPLSAGFAALARIRGGEAVHSRGLVLGGSLAVARPVRPLGAPVLDRPGPYAVQARLSWGLGPVGPLPDVPGLGLRVLDADGRGGLQDLLVDGSLAPPWDAVLRVRRDLRGWYGSPLRLRLGGPAGRPVRVAARLETHGADPPGPLRLDGAREAAAAGRLRVRLVVHSGRRTLASAVAVLDEVAEPANPERPRFDVANTAGGLVTAGFWHEVRRHTYAASRRGDPRTRDPATASTVAETG